jgi:Mce-associated membrane protein
MTVTTDDKTDAVDEEVEAVDESCAGDDESEPSEEANEPDAVDVDEPDHPRRTWRRRVLVGTIALIFVAALGASAVLGWKVWQERQQEHASEQALAAAVSYAQILTSIDSDKVDENFKQVLDGATGEFKDMYSQSSTQLRQLLIDNKAAAHGVVVESAIQSAARDKVVVLLFVDQSVSNTNIPDPRLDRSRIKMTMEFVDGRWRASQIALP